MEVGPTQQVWRWGIRVGAVNTLPHSSIIVCVSEESLIRLGGLVQSSEQGPCWQGARYCRGNGSERRDHLFPPGKAVIGGHVSQSRLLVGCSPPWPMTDIQVNKSASHL